MGSFFFFFGGGDDFVWMFVVFFPSFARHFFWFSPFWKTFWIIFSVVSWCFIGDLLFSWHLYVGSLGVLVEQWVFVHVSLFPLCFCLGCCSQCFVVSGSFVSAYISNVCSGGCAFCLLLLG